jgi:hypothetical protein
MVALPPFPSVYKMQAMQGMQGDERDNDPYRGPPNMTFTQPAPRQRTAIACRYCRRRKVRHISYFTILGHFAYDFRFAVLDLRLRLTVDAATVFAFTRSAFSRQFRLKRKLLSLHTLRILILDREDSRAPMDKGRVCYMARTGNHWDKYRIDKNTHQREATGQDLKDQLVDTTRNKDQNLQAEEDLSMSHTGRFLLRLFLGNHRLATLKEDEDLRNMQERIGKALGSIRLPQRLLQQQ